MAIRRASIREDRRRRVLVDDLVVSPTRPSNSPRASVQKQTTNRYTPAAFAENQPRITDFLPIRPWSLLVLFFIGNVLFATNVLTTLLYYDRWQGYQARFRLFDMTQVGSLGAWVSALVLMLAAVLSMLIFWIRRNRIDDYRGRYRIWPAVTFLLVFASAHAATGLGDLLTFGSARLLRPVYSASTDGVQVVAFLLLAAIAFRTHFEMKVSRVATSFLVSAFLCYATGLFVAIELVPIQPPSLQKVAIAAVTLLGHWFLTMSLVVFARYVFLDAQGQIKKRTSPNRWLSLFRTARLFRWKRAAKQTQKNRESHPRDASMNATAKTTPKNEKPKRRERGTRKPATKESVASEITSESPTKFTQTEREPIARKRTVDESALKTTADRRHSQERTEASSSQESASSNAPTPMTRLRVSADSARRKAAQANDSRSDETPPPAADVIQMPKSATSKNSKAPESNSSESADQELENILGMNSNEDHLSKSEKKRLRKEKRRQRRAA